MESANGWFEPHDGVDENAILSALVCACVGNTTVLTIGLIHFDGSDTATNGKLAKANVDFINGRLDLDGGVVFIVILSL
jgi:hypothetical protein